MNKKQTGRILAAALALMIGVSGSIELYAAGEMSAVENPMSEAVGEAYIDANSIEPLGQANTESNTIEPLGQANTESNTIEPFGQVNTEANSIAPSDKPIQLRTPKRPPQ